MGGGLNALAITTFNAAGLDLYGRRMVDSWCWPMPLRVYAEGFAGDLDLLAVSPWLSAFKTRHAGRRFRDYRWDAVRFAHKVAAVCHAAREPGLDWLIWVDGDTITHAAPTADEMAGLLPGPDEWISWLDRERSYPECGFYILNCRHPRHAAMIAALEAMYAGDGLFALPEWHDSYVLAEVVNAAGVGAKSLSGAGYRTSHPAINGPLGRWIDHMKGPRKAAGRTPRGERVIRDGVEYWR